MLCVLAAALAAPRALAHVRRLTDNAAGSSSLVANFMRIDMETVDDVEIAADTEYVADTDEIGDLCFQRDPSNDALLRFCTAKDAGPLEAFGVRSCCVLCFVARESWGRTVAARVLARAAPLRCL